MSTIDLTSSGDEDEVASPTVHRAGKRAFDDDDDDDDPQLALAIQLSLGTAGGSGVAGGSGSGGAGPSAFSPPRSKPRTTASPASKPRASKPKAKPAPLALGDAVLVKFAGKRGSFAGEIVDFGADAAGEWNGQAALRPLLSPRLADLALEAPRPRP
ncbi:hypothetical protein T492DRAFT_157931 [Pavlovales sp. CCMP2436]|nr:hypothetical protein T492DRAFT_157931 [Pavlovales sp. CCMP2436]